jgi:hypothetical protein
MMQSELPIESSLFALDVAPKTSCSTKHSLPYCNFWAVICAERWPLAELLRSKRGESTGDELAPAAAAAELGEAIAAAELDEAA